VAGSNRGVVSQRSEPAGTFGAVKEVEEVAFVAEALA
jgi:hypothetical protein